MTKNNFDDRTLEKSLCELIAVTTSTLPSDVLDALGKYSPKEMKHSSAKWAFDVMEENMDKAKKERAPLCQDTGTLLFSINYPVGVSTKSVKGIIEKSIVKSTEKGYLRQNSVNSLTGENAGNNLGPGHPSVYFNEHEKDCLEIKLMLKGGGCENVGAQYSLPYYPLNAGRDLLGVKKVILDTVVQAQGKGCGPGSLGVCIGGDRSSSYVESKKQFFRPLNDKNTNSKLAEMEEEIVELSNKLGIGPMGFGGESTLFGCKIGELNRVPASYFVSVSYMCWAFRRQGILLKSDGSIEKWLY